MIIIMIIIILECKFRMRWVLLGHDSLILTLKLHLLSLMIVH